MKCVRSVSISWTNDDVVHIDIYIDIHKTSIRINSDMNVGCAPYIWRSMYPIGVRYRTSVDSKLSRDIYVSMENEECRRGVDPRSDGRERTPIISRAADNWKRTDPNVRPTGRATKINESRHS